jgi:hypothetical protein
MVVTGYVYVNNAPQVKRANDEVDQHASKTADDADPEFGWTGVLRDGHYILGSDKIIK